PKRLVTVSLRAVRDRGATSSLLSWATPNPGSGPTPLRCFPGVFGSDRRRRARLACGGQNFRVWGAHATSLLGAGSLPRPPRVTFLGQRKTTVSGKLPETAGWQPAPPEIRDGRAGK